MREKNQTLSGESGGVRASNHHSLIAIAGPLTSCVRKDIAYSTVTNED